MDINLSTNDLNTLLHAIGTRRAWIVARRRDFPQDAAVLAMELSDLEIVEKKIAERLSQFARKSLSRKAAKEKS